MVVAGAVQRVCDRPGVPPAFLAGRFGGLVERGQEPRLRFTWADRIDPVARRAAGDPAVV